MTERGLAGFALGAGVILATLFCLPSLLPLLAATGFAPDDAARALAAIDWSVTIAHSLLVATLAGLGGAWLAVSTQYGLRPVWGLLSIWLVLAALVPLALLAQCLALMLSFTGGVGRSAALLAGHAMAVLPVTFVLMVRRVALDGNAHYLALRNFGASAMRAQLLLLRLRYRREVALGTVLAFFAILNESAVAGSLGGNTAFFGSVMNAAAFGSADPAMALVGSLVEIVSLAAVMVSGLVVARGA